MANIPLSTIANTSNSSVLKYKEFLTGNFKSFLSKEFLNYIQLYMGDKVNELGIPNITDYKPKHLIYAYFMENSRLMEVFRRVIYEYRHGDRLGVPLQDSQCLGWLYITEQLIFCEQIPFSPLSITSQIRPDSGAIRRNAYWRMFGLDLDHGLGHFKDYPLLQPKIASDGNNYPHIRPHASNLDFVQTFESILTEAWIGIENIKNTSGVNPTDDNAISLFVKQLNGMLMTRRENVDLFKIEFYSVFIMEWLFWVLKDYGNTGNHPVVASLKAEGSNEIERFKKIAERVNLKIHDKSLYFFDFADLISNLLLYIEEKGEDPDPSDYYDTNKDPAKWIKKIITSYSYARNRNLKERPKPVFGH